MPVTTASGKVTGGIGVGVGDGWSVGAAVGEGTSVGLGLGLEHPTSSVTTATAVTRRNDAGALTPLS
jgi:hypothetical protein